MCRLTAYLGKPILAADLVTRPSRSVIRQSFDAKERAGGSGSNVYEIGALNADGFGLGWYTDSGDEDTAPCVYTEVGPAWNNRNLNRLARKISSSCIFAHVRAAGPGMGVCECSCHPFQSGRYLFMHNGCIGGFNVIRRSVLATLKDFSFNYAISNSCSDTALAFAVFLDQLDEPDQQVSVMEMKDMMAKTIAILCRVLDDHNIQETSLLNFVVSDGSAVVATRYSRSVTGSINSCSLYFAAGSSFEVDKANSHEVVNPDCPSGACAHAESGHMEKIQEYRMSHSDGHNGVVIITSEPLTNARADWVPVPENHIIVATSDKQVLLSPLPSQHFQCLGAEDAIRESCIALEMMGHDGTNSGVESYFRGKHVHKDTDGSTGHSPSCGHGGGGLESAEPSRVKSTNNATRSSSEPRSQFEDMVPGMNDNEIFTTDYVLSLSLAEAKTDITKLATSFHDFSQVMLSDELRRSSSFDIAGGSSGTQRSRTPVSQFDASIASIVVSKRSNLIFAADSTARGHIFVWDLEMWSLVSTSRKFDSCIMCMSVDDEHSLLYISCSDNVIYVHDISDIREQGEMKCVLSFAVPNIGHILSLNVMYLNFGVTLLLLGSQDGNVRRICLNSSLCVVTERDEPTQPAWLLVDEERKVSDEEEWCRQRRLKLQRQSPPKKLERPASFTALHTEPAKTTKTNGAEPEPIPTFQQSLIECVLVPRDDTQGRGTQMSGPDTARASHCGFVFSLAVAPEFICSGGGDGFIKLWSTNTLQRLHRLRGHRGQVIALQVDDRSNTLFSAATDRTVRVWDLDTISCRRTLPCASGHILCMQLCIPSTQEISVMSVDVSVTKDSSPSKQRHAAPWSRQQRPGERSNTNSSSNGGVLAVGSDAGYVHIYSLSTLQEVYLLTACEDLPPIRPTHVHTPSFSSTPDENVLAATSTRAKLNCLSYNSASDLLLCGCQDGNVFAWKLRGDSKPTVVQDTLGLVAVDSSDESLQLLSSKTQAGHSSQQEIAELLSSNGSAVPGLQFSDSFFFRTDNMISVLRDFVSIKTVSSSPSHKEDCWRGAKFIATLLEQAGCRVKQCAGPKQDLEIAPVVIGFLPRSRTPTDSDADEARSIVIFGHYDVVAAGDTQAWNSDPWTLSIKNGYIYGRGVTDDKGPLVASIFAAAKLRRENKLQTNVIFLVEGAEESGIGMKARGLDQVVAENEHWFQQPSAVLISNNYWIDDVTPCLTYGMRGVIDFEVSVCGAKRNLHAGFDGGVTMEPISDLMALLASLHDKNGDIAVPGLLDGVRELGPDEQQRFQDIELDAQKYTDSLGVKLRTQSPTDLLQSRWGKPVLTVCCVTSSNSASMFRTIPKDVGARLSLHYVPNQKSADLIRCLKTHLETQFAGRETHNELKVDIKQDSHWWYTDPNGAIFQKFGKSIADVWGRPPALIREGGSYGGITRFLEKKFNAPAIHFPMGQATDNAHLPNERLRLHNLLQGHNVLYNFFQM